jgi:hypothetical protein
MRRERAFPRSAAVTLGVLLGVAGGQVALGAQRGPSRHSQARAARALSVNDTGHLHLLKASGSILKEEGPVSGTLPGRAKVRLDVGANVTASFTIEPHGGGAIVGSGSAVLHSSGRYSSFGGSLSVSHGSGRYAHARGAGKLYGLIERRSDSLTVQTTGTLHY